MPVRKLETARAEISKESRRLVGMRCDSRFDLITYQSPFSREVVYAVTYEDLGNAGYETVPESVEFSITLKRFV